MKTHLSLSALAVCFVALTGCSGSPEGTADGEPPPDQEIADTSEAASSFPTAPACIDRYLTNNALSQRVHVHNGCHDKAHPGGYDARIRIVYGVLGTTHAQKCFVIGAGATREIDLVPGQYYKRIESCL